jgi:myo-inositol catabolism protein IolS
MIYRKLGSTELKVSVIGLGTYQFGGTWGKAFSQVEVNDIFRTAEEEGINLIDTAACYGMHLSESLIGEAIKGNRDNWNLATKFGHNRISRTKNEQRWSAKDVLGQLEESLSYLKTDYIDLYQFHSGSNEMFDNEKLWTMLDKQKQAGKIRYLGVSLSRKSSEWRIYQAEKAKSVGVSVIQVMYNRLLKEAENEVLETCKKDNLGVIARVPLASGLLSGKYKVGTRFSENDSRHKKYSPELIDKYLKELEVIAKEEVPSESNILEWSLAWPLKHSAVSTVIPGVKNREHVRINARAATDKLVSLNHSLNLD